jgi:hypothetical protein
MIEMLKRHEIQVLRPEEHRFPPRNDQVHL